MLVLFVKQSHCIQLPWHGKLSYGRIPATARAKGVSNVGYSIDRHQGRWQGQNFTVTSANSVELTTRWLKLWYLKRRSQCMTLLARRRRTPEFEELTFPAWRTNYVCNENSKTFLLHTIALTRETKLWADTCSCPRYSAVNSGKEGEKNRKPKQYTLTKNLKLYSFRSSELQFNPSHVHFRAIYVAVPKLSGCDTGVAKP